MTYITFFILFLIPGISQAAQYKQARSIDGAISDKIIIRVGDNASIPLIDGNSDYDEYKKWVKDGNSPLPADPILTSVEITNLQRSTAIEQIAIDPNAPSKALRAILLVIMDELNILRQRENDRSADIAAATSLADLKTRWATRPLLSDRVGTQIKTAVQNKINSGVSD